MTTSRHGRTNGAGLGSQRTFTGAALQQVAFPLGGIGTGTVSLGGRGDLRDWEIFNRPAKGTRLPFTFFSLWCKPKNGQADARVLERRLLPPHVASNGLPSGSVAGIPRFAEASFTGAYPLAHIAFADDHVPLQVEVEAFNPFIPLNAEDSGLPVAIFLWRLTNPLDVPVEAAVAFSLFNAVGHDGQAELQRGRRHPMFGGNLNEWVEEKGLCGLQMSGGKAVPTAPNSGSLAIASPWPQTTHLIHWERSGWFDDMQNFWDTWRAAGRLPDDRQSSPSPDGETDVGTLGLTATIPAGGSVELPFILAWHFPNLTVYWQPEPYKQGDRLGNYYTTRFANVWEAARYAATNLARLREETQRYHNTLFESTLPAPVLDAVSSQSSILRTTTCLRTEDGRLHAFEGCFDNAGCCPMNCTHVWNYEQAVAHLFPALERTMRLTDFGVNTLPSGEQRFRTVLPISSGLLFNYQPAADGQMGSVLKLYREWLLSGDKAFLQQMWPHAKRALSFAWEYWDPDRNGVMEGEQHNTYDVEFYGPNSMMGTLYLAALRAAEEMARALGDQAAAEDYRRIYESGRKVLDEELWNGEYYIQKITPTSQVRSRRDRYPQRHPTPLREGEEIPRYQFGPGCLSDQMLGQWFAHVVGLGYVLPQARVRSSIKAIFDHNFRDDLAEHHNCQRTYALNHEGGLLACSWPNGGRPRYPFPYADELWTGIEYQVAAHLIYEGFIDEGLAVVQAVRDRHDGIARNPWDEFECGHHYARAMSSWSLLLALSGYHHHAPAKQLGFAPLMYQRNFRCFFSVGGAWGSYRQQVRGAAVTFGIAVRYGSVTLRTLEFGLPDGLAATQVKVIGPSGRLAAAMTVTGKKLVVALDGDVTLSSAQELRVVARAAS